jgi:hypothetical protein
MIEPCPKGYDRVLVFGDTHCGARTGLTPPGHQQHVDDDNAWPEFLSDDIRRKFCDTQTKTWRWVKAKWQKLGPIKLAICNGDAIDGCGFRSGGQEQITPEHSIQATMAIKAFSVIEAKNWCFTFGTPYHTGRSSHAELQIAQWFKNRPGVDQVKVGAHEWPEVNHYTFDVKHKVGGSTTPYGRGTSIMKEDLWNQTWHAMGGQPRADILIRSHVHYYQPMWRVVNGRRKFMSTLPALQALGTNYGGEQCSGTVDYGFCYIDVPRAKRKNAIWHEEILDMKEQAATTTKF